MPTISKHIILLIVSLLTIVFAEIYKNISVNNSPVIALLQGIFFITFCITGGYLYKSLVKYFETEKIKLQKNLEQQSEELISQRDEIIQQKDKLANMLDLVSKEKQYSEILNKVNEQIFLSTNLDEVCDAIFNNCIDTFNCQAGMIIVIHPRSKRNKVITSKGLSLDFLNGQELDTDLKLNGIIKRCVDEKKIINLSYPQSALQTDVYLNISCQMIHEVYFPFISYDNTVGAMVLGRLNDSIFTQDEIELINKISHQAALAIYNSFTYLEMEETYTQLYEQGVLVNELNEQLSQEKDNIKLERNIAQSVINSINEGICMVDLQGDIVVKNSQWEKYFKADENCKYQLPYAKIFGKSLNNLLKSTEENISLDEIFTDTNLQTTFEVTLEDHVLKLWTGPVTNGSDTIIGRLFVYHDKTKEAEIDRIKSEFVATVSHELRTPLTSILGFSELLTNKQFSEAKKEKYIKTILKEAQRLTELINNFLDLQRMELGKQVYNFSKVDATELIQESINIFLNKTTKHQIITELPENRVFVLADSQRIIQVIVNLISNAIKFSPNSDTIIIGMSIEKGMAQFYVNDYGLGIPENVLANLFQKFYRVDNSDRRKIGGTGLGLSICKEIVQSHKGQIWVQSEYGVGSTFYFTLPLADQLSITTPCQNIRSITKNISSEQEITLNCQKDNLPLILVVEDDTSTASLFTEELERNGYRVLTTESGENALAIIQKVKPHAIILDILLQGKLNGWTVLQCLKQDTATANIPIILSSCLSDREFGLAMGANEYLIKPFEPEVLINVLKKFISSTDPYMVLREKDGVENWILTSLKERGLFVKDIVKDNDLVYIALETNNEGKY